MDKRSVLSGWSSFAVGKTTRWTVDFSNPLVQNDNRSPMLTSIGNVLVEPGKGSTGTAAHLLDGVRISRPGCDGNLNNTRSKSGRDSVAPQMFETYK